MQNCPQRQVSWLCLYLSLKSEEFRNLKHSNNSYLRHWITHASVPREMCLSVEYKLYLT